LAGTHTCQDHEICSNIDGSFDCIDETQCGLCSHDCVNGKCACPTGMTLDESGTLCQLADDDVAIKCDPSYMEILIDKSYFESSDGFQLNDANCNVNSGHITDQGDGTYSIRVGLDECATDIEIVGEDIIFSNILYNNYQTNSNDAKNSLIFKQPIVTVKFKCVYSTTLDVDGSHTVEAAFVRGHASGRGDFTFDLETFSDSEFSVPASTGFRTGDIMFFDIVNANPMKGIKFTVMDCTVYNEDKTESYPVISNKCGDDYIATKHLDGYAVEERARFSYTVFEFVDANDGEENQTLQCKITVCHKNDINYVSCIAPCPGHVNL